MKGYPFEVAVPEALPVDGVVLSDQVKSLDWRARGAELACALPAELTAAVLARFGTARRAVIGAPVSLQRPHPGLGTEAGLGGEAQR